MDVKYQIRGCPVSIACANAMSSLAMGRSQDEDIVEALDGLPEHKLHCSNLRVVGLRKAIADYFEKHTKGGKVQE